MLMKNRYCVIMCGGAGSRFWPFSRNRRPKQFLDFFGTGRSLLQLTVERMEPLVGRDHIVLVTNAMYAGIIAEQLPDIPAANILCEPARRNTTPCICWAAHHIAAKDPDAVLCVLPSDHLVLKEEAFRTAMDEAMTFAAKGDRLLTLGVLPASPNTGYGYIQRGRPVATCIDMDEEDIYKVKSFTEKPDPDMARLFVDSGEFYWNSGIFVWSVRSILNAFRRYAPETEALFEAGRDAYGTPREREFIESVFPSAPNISVDYAIMEKADNVFVKSVDFGWSDLGTWKALYDVSPRNADGNVTQNCNVLATDCHDSVFAVNGDKIVVASGLDGYIVADNGNALLICPIDQEQRVRQTVNDVRSRFGEEYV